MEEYSIGIDIGGTKIAAGLINKTGQVLYKKTKGTSKESSIKILEQVKEMVLRFINISEREGFKLAGIGIGSAGQIDYKKGEILSGTKNIKDWNHVNITQYLKNETDLPIWLDNDANTFAIAEHRIGKGKGFDDIVCLTLGTGVGGGVITSGKVVHGKWGGAAELGHITVNMNGADCNCGSKGCLEVYASGTGIANRMKGKLEQITTEDVCKDVTFYKNNPGNLTSKEVFQWYNEGFPLAKEVIDMAIRALSYGIVNIIHTFNPSIMVLGGALVEHRDWLPAAIKEKISNKGISSLVEPVDIYVSELGYDAGLIGAGLQIWENTHIQV